MAYLPGRPEPLEINCFGPAARRQVRDPEPGLARTAISLCNPLPLTFYLSQYSLA